jgi:hypothetical protein
LVITHWDAVYGLRDDASEPGCALGQAQAFAAIVKIIVMRALRAT